MPRPRKLKKSLGEPGKERRSKRRRLRREPAEARAHILAAAQRVFADKGPDAAGLKDVAREAGVSHGLVTHYFGTFDALVEATLEATAHDVEERILAKIVTLEEVGVDTLLDLFFDGIARPEHGRLVAWAFLSGRADSADFFARRVQGPRRVADAIAAQLGARHPGKHVDRAEIDRMVMMVMALGFGFSFGGGLLWDALGHTATPEAEAAFRRWLGELVRTRMERVLSEAPASAAPPT